MLSDIFGFLRRSSKSDIRRYRRARRKSLCQVNPRGPEIMEARRLLSVEYDPVLIPDTIHIKTGGTDDVIPEFVKASQSALELTGTSPFNWSTGANWVGGSAPTASSKIRVKTGQVLVVDTNSAVVGDIEVQSGGTLKFNNASGLSTDIQLTFDTLTVLPGGTLNVDFSNTTDVGTHKAYLTVRNTALQTTGSPPVDGFQWGQGLLVFGDATLKGHFTGPTFVAIASGAASGTSTATLVDDVTWNSGDDLVFPDTRQKTLYEEPDNANYSAVNDYATNYQIEKGDFSSYVSGTKVLTLQSNLANSHSKLSVEGVDYLPHVANITRNVIISSASPTGTRGHTLFGGTGKIDIHDALFEGPGARPLVAICA